MEIGCQFSLSVTGIHFSIFKYCMSLPGIFPQVTADVNESGKGQILPQILIASIPGMFDELFSTTLKQEESGTSTSNQTIHSIFVLKLSDNLT